jgi:hypothetical protein
MTSSSSASPTNMQRPAPTRTLSLTACAIALALCAHPPTHAQPAMQRRSVLPSTAPTIPAPQPASPTAGSTPAVKSPANQSPARADITYGAGQLSVKANNASLNQILREISQQTGMKITGGVAEERVFGTYGPAPAAKVLADLLDGTSSNVLLIQGTGRQGPSVPVELVLTPRHGGPTPPNPNARGFDQGPIAGRIEPSQPTPANDPNFNAAQQPPPPPSAPGDPNQATQPAAPAPATTPADGTQPQSPNDVKTPQQIYEQLMRLRQQPTTPPTQ